LVALLEQEKLVFCTPGFPLLSGLKNYELQITNYESLSLHS